ncbi:MAG TPA: zinc-ribbon domain-containing protein, partial [Polyangiaceae bacterium]|nr:zinc-ribbon domain-containing protein [Polyangiaceae bacterium]
MKFNCENCQAKYQIADEKIAGRSVRMKCRTCGQPIDLRAPPVDASATLVFSANLLRAGGKEPSGVGPAGPGGRGRAARAAPMTGTVVQPAITPDGTV